MKKSIAKLGLIVMLKPDKDLPWRTRIASWGLVIFFISYGGLLLVEKYKEVFP